MVSVMSSRVWREMMMMVKSPIDGIRITMDLDLSDEFLCEIDGPVGSPYEGGIFRLKLEFFEDGRPRLRFLTPIHHPNISNAGAICLNLLDEDWNADIPITTLLVSIQALLSYPNPEDAILEDVGEDWLLHPEENAKIARNYTRRYAMNHDE